MAIAVTSNAKTNRINKSSDMPIMDIAKINITNIAINRNPKKGQTFIYCL